MYAKVLKESASALTLLTVDFDATSRDMIGINLKLFFKNVTYASGADEALWLCRSEKFDLIAIDIDAFAGDVYGFIDNIRRHDTFQAIAVCSSRIDDTELLLKLLNSQIACLIPKPSETDAIYKILSHACGRIHDRMLLMHYVETLENHQELVPGISCQFECPISKERSAIGTMAVQHTDTAPEADDDDFMFIIDAPAVTTSAVDPSIYQDYFQFLDADDHEELHDLINDIDAALLNAFDKGGDEAEISRLGSSLVRYGNVLLHYQFFSDMGSVLLEFGNSISEHANLIAAGSEDIHMVISGFCTGLQTFLNEVWEKECDNPKIFNDSIINDARTIVLMILPAQSTEGSDDSDLFFF